MRTTEPKRVKVDGEGIIRRLITHADLAWRNAYENREKFLMNSGFPVGAALIPTCVSDVQREKCIISAPCLIQTTLYEVWQCTTRSKNIAMISACI